MKAKSSDFKFKSYWIKKASIDLKKRTYGDESFSIGIKPSGIKKGKDFTLTFEIVVTSKNEDVKIELTTEGFFELRDNLAMDKISNYFFVNAPAILFPYIRAYISTLSAQSGIKPIVIPTLNLQSLGEQLKASITTLEE